MASSMPLGCVLEAIYELLGSLPGASRERLGEALGGLLGPLGGFLAPPGGLLGPKARNLNLAVPLWDPSRARPGALLGRLGGLLGRPGPFVGRLSALLGPS